MVGITSTERLPVELLGPGSDAGPHLGGKGRALARLVAGGFPVPDSGVVTLAAYRAVAGDDEVAATVEAIADGRQQQAARVDEAFARAPVDPELLRAITDLAATVGRGGPIAVRSSATVEDLHGSSFAGQYRSLLDIDSSDPDDVMAAVRQVWASLWHPAPAAYRRAFGIDESDVAMAVVLMRMVPADTAGVVFTVDPGGSGGARVEAVEGLGESLVSGQRTPSAWVVPVVEVDGTRRALADETTAGPIARAVDLALDAERLFDGPQDVEWAAVGDDVQVVQARPITALDDSDGFDTAIDDHELATAGIVEMVPGVLPPLRWELNRFLLEEAFRSVLDSVGLLEGEAIEEEPLVRRVRGRAAIDFDQLRAVAANIPGAAAELERQYFDREAEEGREATAGSDGGRSGRWDRGWLRGLRQQVQTMRTRRQVVDQADMLVLATAGLRDRRPALAPLDDAELLAYLRRLVDLAARGLTAELGVAAAGAASYRRLELVLTGYLGDPQQAAAAAQAVTARSGAAVERDRSASAAVFAGSTWEERGTRPPSPPEPDRQGFARDRAELERRLRATPGWTRRRVLTGQVIDTRIALLRRTIQEVVEQLRRREATKAAFLELGGEARRVLLEIGSRLVERELLDDATDVELLATGELTGALLAGEEVAVDLLRHRRKWIGRYEAEGALPVRFRGIPSRAPAPLPRGDRLEGWAASPGRVRGRARVVGSADDRFLRGEVLVAEATDASWSPLFVRARAVVVERGGPLSHAAILARELGLPAVLNLPGATGVLDGKVVVVDGDRGMVVIEAPDDAPDDPPAGTGGGDGQPRSIGDPPVGTGLPWPGRRHPPADPFEGIDVDRPLIFVPAIMSAGLVFSIASLLGDLFRWGGGRARARRTRLEAGAVLGELLGHPEPSVDDLGILSRPAYLASALVLTAGAASVTIGSIATFLGDQGQFRDIGWLLAISLVLALLLGFLGGVSFAVFRSWPRPPTWTLGSLRTTPLTATAGRAGNGPGRRLSVATAAAAVLSGLLCLVVGVGRDVAQDVDDPIAEWIVGADGIDALRLVDPFGNTTISIAFVALIGLAGFRCRVMAWSFPAAFVVAWLSTAAIRELVDRPRPVIGGDLESFPSGHLVQAVFVAGLVPLAVAILLAAPRLAATLRLILGAGVVAAALLRVHAETHFPLDVLGGASLGLTVVLATHWVVAHQAWHRECPACPWSPRPEPPRWHRGLFHLEPYEADRIGRFGAIGAVLAALVLAVATLAVGLPRDPEGFGLGTTIVEEAQIGLAVLMGSAGLLALRRPLRAPAAVLMAVAATGLGVLASVEYRPLLAVTLTLALLAPAVVTWLAWQPDETVGSVSALAAVTGALLVVTALGSQSVFNYYFGPTHPVSGAPGLELGEGDWAWLGGVTGDEAVIVVGGLDRGDATTLWYRPQGVEGLPETTEALADEDGLARFELDGLSPGVRYEYGVDESDEIADDLAEAEAEAGTETGRGRWAEAATASFRTFERGPQNLVVALGSCARVGSNGAVFDTIVGHRPDLFLALGDLHYANLDSVDPADHIAQYARAASQPGQAAVFSAIPTAYVWDDHDYGPNDSDASSPTRPAVGEAYRRAIPNYGVDPDPDAPISQAFTVGRVRFVLSDTRSQRDAGTMLGQPQLRWLIDELVESSATHALVVWANPSPWVGPDTPGADSWAGHPEERAAISRALAEAGVDNLVMVSGDAHMVAIDDGTNTAYNGGTGPGFPLLHAAALDRPGSIKGGPYSEGAIAGGGQFGLLEIFDDGGPTVEVRLSGRRWDREELLSYRFDVSPASP